MIHFVFKNNLHRHLIALFTDKDKSFTFSYSAMIPEILALVIYFARFSGARSVFLVPMPSAKALASEVNPGEVGGFNRSEPREVGE